VLLPSTQQTAFFRLTAKRQLVHRHSSRLVLQQRRLSVSKSDMLHQAMTRNAYAPVVFMHDDSVYCTVNARARRVAARSSTVVWDKVANIATQVNSPTVEHRTSCTSNALIAYYRASRRLQYASVATSDDPRPHLSGACPPWSHPTLEMLQHIATEVSSAPPRKIKDTSCLGNVPCSTAHQNRYKL
jgi:hypothetical protein